MSKVFIPVLLMVLFSCNPKLYSPLDYQGEMIIWGTGGGFTGGVSTFCLMDNGHFFRSEDAGKSYSAVGKLSKSSVKTFFHNYHTFALDKVILKEPGNKYFYLIHKHNGKEHKLIWGFKEPENKVPAILHKNLTGTLKSLQS